MSLPLPYLQQGSTLSIRSHVPNTQLEIQSQWRDDGHLDATGGLKVDITKHDQDKMTSIGREATHVSMVFQGDIEGGTDKDSPSSLATPTATLTVPEKLNLDCELEEGGSITIKNKLEGDVRLITTDGSITVKKIRGHILSLKASGGAIHIRELAESQTLTLQSNERIRAKRIHASDMDITVTVDENESNAEDSECEASPLAGDDDDDAGAMVDVSSLYIVGDANVQVTTAQQPMLSKKQSRRQAVRIKSHHGHIH
ncbi:MAG: hypothetical protein SGARI_007238, partial [Bacillariaceae sp.]